jgi:hypothetical protein
MIVTGATRCFYLAVTRLITSENFDDYWWCFSCYERGIYINRWPTTIPVCFGSSGGELPKLKVS